MSPLALGLGPLVRVACRSRAARWHVFTCIGGYIAVALVDMLTSGRVAEDPTASLAWPVSVVGRYIDEAGTGHVKQ